jgi:hypothetical protein
MASIPHEQHPANAPRHDRRVGERRSGFYAAMLRSEGMKVSWGGIFGGVLVAVGLLFLLGALGVAVGISAADPGETQASTLGAGAAIWSGLSLLLALFVGGMVSTRIGAITDGTTGFVEGVLVWVVSILMMVYFVSSGVSTLAGSAFRMVGGATQAVGSVVQSGGANVDTSGSVDQIVQRLKDPKTAQQIASATGMEQGDVRSALSQTAQRVEKNRDDPTKAAAEAKAGMSELLQKAKASGALEQKAVEMQPQASRAAWITFGALVLSLLAAVIGAMSGRRKPQLRAR